MQKSAIKFFRDVALPRNSLGILQLGIEIIIIFSQQGGVGENFVHNPSSK
jgi:hypothetical protein